MELRIANIIIGNKFPTEQGIYVSHYIREAHKVTIEFIGQDTVC